MKPRRLTLGRDLHVVGHSPDGLDLEGEVRLRPGQLIELVTVVSANDRPVVGQASVQTWSVAQLGSSGTIYRGHCLWQHDDGN